MEFDRSFGPAEFGPVKQSYGKVDDWGIQAAQRILETKFLRREHLAAAALKQTEKDFLADCSTSSSLDTVRMTHP